MADKEFLGGVTNTTLHFETDGTMHVEEKQDCEPILEYAKAGRDNRFSADSMDGMLRHVAEVPMVEFIKWCREAGCEPGSQEAMFVMEKKLADPAYAKFLAAPKVRDPHVIIKGAR